MEPTVYTISKRTVTNPPTNLWQEIRDNQHLYGVLWPQQFATMLRTIANHVERRGARDLDRDPGETADWLREQAHLAEQQN